ncbi:hypothetical protein DFAR_150004 [Desulfarculales bacterium]
MSDRNPRLIQVYILAMIKKASTAKSLTTTSTT